jgi:signal transduction histidine kinase/CheY-like chemotaxis protein
MLEPLSRLPFLRNPLVKTIEQDSDPINQARFIMMIYSVLFSLTLTAILIPIYIINGPQLQLIRSIIVFAGLIGILKLLTVRPVWRKAAHGLEIIITLLVWSNVFIFIQGINIITLQYVFLSIILGFYVLGTRWGILYSAINILPVIYSIVSTGQGNIHLLVSPQQISNPIFYIILCHNFFLIVYAHFHFFRSFQRVIKELNIAGNIQKSLNERLQEAMEEAKVSSQAKLDFLSTMSHELRTPLNGVIGMTNILLLENPRKEQEENLNILKFSAESLLSLVNDILDFNKIGSDKVSLEYIDFNLAKLMQNCCADLSFKAKEKGLSFELLMDAQLSEKTVKGDPTRLSQIVFNLLSNAVKFTAEGSITVKVTVVSMAEGIIKTHFSIKDTGIGISDDKKAVIFEPFMQASKNTTRKYGGTGLGLSIVKLLLELKKSNINFTSTPGKGTEFFFDLTLGYAIDEQLVIPDKKLKKSHDLSDLQVLVAEDNMINILFMEKLFSNWNLEPIIAKNGQEAVDRLASQHFDVILMDIDMPVMDGLEATALIRAMEDKQKAGIHIIALTASVGFQARETVMKAGLDDYLEKPFDLDDLKEKLERIYFLKVAGKKN